MCILKINLYIAYNNSWQNAIYNYNYENKLSRPEYLRNQNQASRRVLCD